MTQERKSRIKTKNFVGSSTTDGPLNDRVFAKEFGARVFYQGAGGGEAVVMTPKEDLIGCPFAVRFADKRNELFMSPSVKSLIETDYDRIKHQLRVRLYKGSPRSSVFKNIREQLSKTNEKP